MFSRKEYVEFNLQITLLLNCVGIFPWESEIPFQNNYIAKYLMGSFYCLP